MPAAYTTLDLAPAALPGGTPPGGLAHPRSGALDLVVDGRPLLHRLDEADGADVVSPLAADLPPALRAAHVRRLLDPAPSLADGRQVIYSCPDCDDLGCGAVTAVVERDDENGSGGEDGDDGGSIVWRDFAWQTGPTADPSREGYPGVGPYRFHGPAYRAVLLRLAAGS
ncbi:hypothetical protein AB0M38_26430 [Streptomyces sp. NPDC051742]|uniref:hypothetical protein n=1 Tax=unclassified Streptomyces TaxID=2593676 RepID=UPI00342ADF37